MATYTYTHTITPPIGVGSLAGKQGTIRLVASTTSAGAMGHAGGRSIYGEWPFTLDSTGTWSLSLEKNADITSPANTVYEERLFGRGRKESDPLYFEAVAGGGDITTMLRPFPTALPMSYPTFLVGIDGGVPSSVYGPNNFDGGTP